jgi:peroxiredoxin
VLVALSSDSPEQARELKSKLGLDFEVVSDENLEIAARYGVRQQEKEAAVPATFVVGEDGRIEFRKVGENIPDRAKLAEIVAALRSN